jgi:hypothetical protein
LAARHGWDYRRRDPQLAAAFPPRFARESPGPNDYLDVVTGQYRGYDIVIASFPHPGVDESGPEPWMLMCLRNLPQQLPRRPVTAGKRKIRGDSDPTAGISILSGDPAWGETFVTYLDAEAIRRRRIRWQVEDRSVGMWVRGRPAPLSVDYHLNLLVNTWKRVDGAGDNDGAASQQHP